MPTYDVLAQLRTEWTHVAHDHASRDAWRFVRERHDLSVLDAARDLGDVVTMLEPRGGLTQIERALVVTVLLQEAQHRVVHRALLQTLLPGMVSTCRQLRFGQGIVARPSDVVNEAVTQLSALLHEWAGEHRAYAAPDLLSALRGRLRRWLLKEKERQARRGGDVPETATAPVRDVILSRLESLAQHDAYERLARLTYARVYEGTPLYALAKAEGVTPSLLQRELQRFATDHLL